ncbi:HDOD domain-containing protein [Thiohalorhabdus sp.]|uniref:HDOD domain-containing protein n=1 Tax=Thiohalorhabdus sp. TaxID=3094134 RepID=UPI002FC369DE
MTTPTNRARRRVLETQELPPLPMVAGELLGLLQSDSDDQFEQLRVILERDPGLSARVMGWANSAYFGTRGNVRHLDRAIFGILGLRTVKSLLLSILLSRAFDTRSCPHFDLTNYWYCALLTGHCAKAMTPRRQAGPPLDSENAFLGGLLHNLGTLLLVHLYPEAMDGVLKGLDDPDDGHLRDAEMAAIGVDHCAAGAGLGRRWHLPDDVIGVIANYSTQRPEETGALPVQVGLCRQQVDALLATDKEDPATSALQVPQWLPIAQEHWNEGVGQMIRERGRLRNLARDMA